MRYFPPHPATVLITACSRCSIGANMNEGYYGRHRAEVLHDIASFGRMKPVSNVPVGCAANSINRSSSSSTWFSDSGLGGSVAPCRATANSAREGAAPLIAAKGGEEFHQHRAPGPVPSLVQSRFAFYSNGQTGQSSKETNSIDSSPRPGGFHRFDSRDCHPHFPRDTDDERVYKRRSGAEQSPRTSLGGSESGGTPFHRSPLAPSRPAGYLYDYRDHHHDPRHHINSGNAGEASNPGARRDYIHGQPAPGLGHWGRNSFHQHPASTSWRRHDLGDEYHDDGAAHYGKSPCVPQTTGTAPKFHPYHHQSRHPLPGAPPSWANSDYYPTGKTHIPQPRSQPDKTGGDKVRDVASDLIPPYPLLL